MIKQRAKLNTNRLNPKLKKELNDAESLKQAGFNPKTKQINPAVYGSTEPFNAVEAMKEDQNLNIVDEEFSNINITNYEKLTEQAMNAIEAERTSISTEQLTQETEASGVAPEVQAQQVIELPTDPKGKMEFIINQYPDVKFPSIDHLMGWKSVHNKIFFLPIPGADYVFIYRYLKNQEYKQLMKQQVFIEADPMKRSEIIFRKCVLWPQFQVEELGALPAGTFDLISEQIQIQSMFLDPVQVAQLVIKI